MAVQLIVLRGVPEDEAEDIRKLLREARIDYYETPEGNWGVSLPAIWLQDDSALERAERLLAEYQAKRVEKVRDDYDRQAKEHKLGRMVDRFRDEPLRILIYLAIVAAVLYFSTMPFLSLGNP